MDRRDHKEYLRANLVMWSRPNNSHAIMGLPGGTSQIYELFTVLAG